MKKTESNKALRKLAEKFLATKVRNTNEFSEMTVREMICELQVQQVELEIQNDELRNTQTTLEELKNHFEELYLFAPVGYLTLSSKREVLEENNMALKLLGGPRGTLIKKDFLCFIAPEDQAIVMQTLESHDPDHFLQDIKVHHHPPGVQFIDIKVRVENLKLSPERYYKMILSDCTERNRMQSKLNNSQQELKLQFEILSQKNAALQELMGQIETGKNRIKESVTFNAEKLLLPLIKRIKNGKNRPSNKSLELLETNVSKITSQFGLKISKELATLSGKEIEISNMVRAGFTSKEISNSLGVSIKTIETHRKNIRKKLGIKNNKINLASYLNSI